MAALRIPHGFAGVDALMPRPPWDEVPFDHSRGTSCGPGFLRLIDVGRVARFRRRRWIVKDLASLLASASREGIPHTTARRFLRRYLAATGRAWSQRRLLRAVREKAEVYRRHNEKREGA